MSFFLDLDLHTDGPAGKVYMSNDASCIDIVSVPRHGPFTLAKLHRKLDLLDRKIRGLGA